jgi:hypothetical protein
MEGLGLKMEARVVVEGEGERWWGLGRRWRLISRTRQVWVRLPVRVRISVW